MTGVRESFIFALEDAFGEGKGNANPWIAPPPGSFFNSTHSRQATKIYTVGSKFFDTVAYGQLNGSFNWTFNFDYYYLEPLQLAFEKVGYVPSADGTHYTHTFEKVNNMRVPSFSVRRKILNQMAGGPDYSDEITELRGCVVRNISFSKAAGTSQLQVTFTGFYTDERMYKGELDATDYKPYEGKLSEYMCMFIGDVGSDAYVANTESLEFSLENNSDAVYNTCSPFAGIYYEGRTNVTFGTTCYSNNPSNYKQRVYSGGYKNDVFKPQAKGLKPIPKVTLAAYDKSIRDDEYGDIDNYSQALADSDESMVVEITDVVIKSLTWPKGNDQKLPDTISSAECRNLKITIINTIPDTTAQDSDMRYNSNNQVNSIGYGIILIDPEGNTFSPRSVISKLGSGQSQVVPTLPTVTDTKDPLETFMGWWTTSQNSATEASGVQIKEGDPITQNTTVYARWGFDVKFYGNGGTIPDGQGQQVEELTKTCLSNREIGTLPTATRTDYLMLEWNTLPDGTGVTITQDTVITEPLNIYAIWAAPVTITFNGNASTINDDPVVITGETSVEIPLGSTLSALPSASSSGHVFSEWNTASDGSGTTVTTSTVFTSNETVYAIWSS